MRFLGSKSEIERFQYLTAWVLSTWASTPKGCIEGCKPYNPILGEVFKCFWKHEDGSKSEFLCEQVSHHPPISAFFFKNDKLFIHGFVEPKTSFSLNSVTTEMKGAFVIETEKERYTVKMPQVSVRGLVWGTQRVELWDEMVIEKQGSDLKAVLKFNNMVSVDGDILKGDEPIFQITGTVNDMVNIINLENDEQQILYEYKKLKVPELQVAPLEQQQPNESRKNWYHVTQALLKEDYELANQEKIKIEEAQKELRNQRTSEWKPKYFRFDGEDWVLHTNGNHVDKKQ